MITSDRYIIRVSISGVPYMSSETLSLSALLRVVEYAARIYDGAPWSLSITVDRDHPHDPKAKNVIRYYPYDLPKRIGKIRTAALIDLDGDDDDVPDEDPDCSEDDDDPPWRFENDLERR